jgi:DnaA-homolog protein
MADTQWQKVAHFTRSAVCPLHPFTYFPILFHPDSAKNPEPGSTTGHIPGQKGLRSGRQPLRLHLYANAFRFPRHAYSAYPVMRQLTLDVRPEIPCTLDNFVPGPNAGLLAALRGQVQARDGSWLYLWGRPGHGRSHLLRGAVAEALARGRGARYLAAPDSRGLQIGKNELVAIDDVDRLNEAGQAALFRALIQAPEAHATLILAGGRPPRQLKLREDVRTRIGQALSFEIQPLDDISKGILLQQQATARGITLDAEIVDYLLRHSRRDTGWLMSVLDGLDEASLTLARPVTLPLLREMLQPDDEPELPF